MGRLEGRVAVITGSSMGIGRAIAERYVAEGAAVVVNSRDRGRAETVAGELRSNGGRAAGVGGDVTDPGQMRALADAAVEAFGGLDVWVNNAGINAIGPSEELDPEAFRRVVEVNLGGCFHGAQAAARVMIPRGGGVIVQVGSILGRTAFPMRAAYTSAKHGLLGLTKVLAAEWAGRGIRVVCIDPAYIRTALDEADQTTGGYSDADIERRTPMGRYGTVQEVAGVAVFVASDDASYVTGSSVTLDGGWLAYGGW